MSKVDPEVLKRLRSEDWKTIYPKLVLYASWLVKSCYWHTGSTNLPKGNQVEDIVQEAIKLVYTGKRQWDLNKVQDALVFLKGVIRSLVNHLVESATHKRQQPLVAKDDDPDSPPLEGIADPTPSNAEEELIAKEMREYLLGSAGDDEDMQMVLLGLYEGMKRSEIANSTGLPLSKVDATMKRIRRALKRYLEREEL